MSYIFFLVGNVFANCLCEAGKKSPPEKTNQREAAPRQADHPTPVLPKRSPSRTKRRTGLRESSPATTGAARPLETEMSHRHQTTRGSPETGAFLITVVAGAAVLTFPETMAMILVVILAVILVVIPVVIPVVILVAILVAILVVMLVVILVGAEVEVSQAGETTAGTGGTGIDRDTCLPQEIAPTPIFRIDIGDSAHLDGK